MSAGSPKVWGGRFEGEQDRLFKEFNDSLRFDMRLVAHDLVGSWAWAEALHRAGILEDEELERLHGALTEIGEEVSADQGPLFRSDAEDVHSWVEARLIEKVGALGKKLHTGRSRNDQVATDLRLFVRDEIDARLGEIHELQRSLLDLAAKHVETILPGYTHLQRAQPVTFAHWALAYVEMLERDAERFEDSRLRTEVCPLGSGALAGTGYPIDRQALAESLGFERASENSLDAVSDRDFAWETVGASALCALHLSRLAEDLVLYTTGEFGFVELDDSVSTGSSLMPQKKNPDALELIRAKVGRIFGAQTALTLVLKGLPLAYNKDLQEDKEPLFDALDQLSLCLRVLPRVLDTLRTRPERMRDAAQGGYSNATDLADYLVGKGLPFREAHEIVGGVVRAAIQLGVGLEDLPLEVLRQHAPVIKADVYERLSLSASIASRAAHGGTSPERVREALRRAKARHEQNSEHRAGAEPEE
jgi:argininosuccinate lyase